MYYCRKALVILCSWADPIHRCASRGNISFCLLFKDTGGAEVVGVEGPKYRMNRLFGSI